MIAVLNGDIENAIAASTPGGIERQEEEGQKATVESEQIPKEISGATREQLTKIGFKFGAEIDELLVNCELPSGWTRRATEHSLYSELTDDKGRVRAEIFYKAAFYDRRADMRMLPRFRIAYHAESERAGFVRCVVLDGDEVVFDAGDRKRGNYDHYEILESACLEWLRREYPNSKDATAYW